MAYKKQNTVDYFPHDVAHGRKMFIVRNKFGNDGYAIWFMLLEELGDSHNHHIDLSEPTQLMFLSAKMMVSEEMLTDVIELLVSMGEIDVYLWQEFRVIWIQKFIDSISDAYKRRKAELIDYHELCKHFSEKCNIIEDPDSAFEQSKSKSKSKSEREREERAQPSDFDGYEDDEIPEVFETEIPPPNGAQSAAKKHLDEVRRTGTPGIVARSPQELYEMIADRVLKDPEWWRAVKEYCKIQHMSRGEIEIALRKWAAYIFQAREASLTSWRKLDASMQSWLLRETRPAEPEKLKL